MKTTESKSSSDTSHVSIPTLAPAEKGSFFSAGKQESNSFFGPHFIQPKLKIGKPNDKYEQEADRVADQVMRMPDSQVQREPIREEEERLQKKAEVKVSGSGESVAGPQLSNQIKSKSGTGNPLPNNVRSEMGHKMGADFSDLNIHTDSKSHQLNRQLGARAFTHGRDIYFNEGEYSPDSQSGKRLLAHELTHVVQQGHISPISNIVQRVSWWQKFKTGIGLGPSEKELIKDLDTNAKKASKLLKNANNTLKGGRLLFKNQSKISKSLLQASRGLEKISAKINKIKKGVSLAQNAIDILNFVEAVEDVNKVNIYKDPDKAAKAFDKLFRSSGKIYGLLPKSIQNIIPELKILQNWGNFFENMTYGLNPAKRSRDRWILGTSTEDIVKGSQSWQDAKREKFHQE